MSESAEYLEFESAVEWRAWLAEYHARVSVAWLVLYKKKHRGERMSLDQAVEEALCYGWIDGRLKGLDEQRYALRFTPRRRNSIWSESNKRRVEKLIREGKMTKAGLTKVAAAHESGQWRAAARREQTDVIPPALEQALSQREGGLEAYRALPTSRKKQFIYWLQSAKRPDTKERRIQAILAEVLGE